MPGGTIRRKVRRRRRRRRRMGRWRWRFAGGSLLGDATCFFVRAEAQPPEEERRRNRRKRKKRRRRRRRKRRRRWMGVRRRSYTGEVATKYGRGDDRACNQQSHFPRCTGGGTGGHI